MLKAAKWVSHGTPRKMKPRASSARHTEQAALCACLDVCISPGKTTTRCRSKPTRARKSVCSTSTASRRNAPNVRGKDTPSQIGNALHVVWGRRHPDWERFDKDSRGERWKS